MMFRLALALGKTVQELRATLSYAEFVEWCAFYEIEPFGDRRADLRAGILAAELRNCYARIMGGKVAAVPADFLPTLSAGIITEPVDTPELTDEELSDWADAAIFGIAPGA